MNKTYYFMGNEVSQYGAENGKVDFRTLSQAFDHVLCNGIMELIDWDNTEQINGFCDEEDMPEIFQYYIVNEYGANILHKFTNEIVFYDYKHDIYIWGITHFGTAWNYVLTDIPIE